MAGPPHDVNNEAMPGLEVEIANGGQDAAEPGARMMGLASACGVEVLELGDRMHKGRGFID